MKPDSKFLSIRWQLPISYAGIALLSALALGLVLTLTLRDYYDRQERQFLQGNAEQISLAAAQMLELAKLYPADQPANVMQDQVTSWSFLLQARLQVLDQDGAILADSGIPDESRVMIVAGLPNYQIGSGLTGDLGANGVVTAGGVYSSGGMVNLPSWGMFFLPENEVISGSNVIQVNPNCVEESCISTDQSQPVLEVSAAPLTAAVTSTVSGSTGSVGITMLTSHSLYGFNLDPVGTAILHRSRQKVEQPVKDGTGNLLGTIVLSDGPAYGDDIVNQVSLAWLIASIIAVVVAASVGWLVSRRVTTPLLALTGATTRMATGDLSARAEVSTLQFGKTTEFVRLGKSFNQMAARVEEIVGTLREFIADAAHGLNTPLTALRTNLELASDETDANRRADFLVSALEQNNRLESLVNGLLELSRLEAVASKPVYTSVDLNQLVGDIEELYASRIEQSGQTFLLDLPQEHIKINGSATYLHRAIENLLDNALKFTPEAGVIRLQLRRDDTWVMLVVEDSGIGIPPEDLPHLFERFHRGRNVAEYPGNGLGLAIVKAIMDAHHGQVVVESKTGETRFILRFLVNTKSGDVYEN